MVSRARAAAALVPLLLLAGCAGAPAGGPGLTGEPPCVAVDEAFYPTSAELEAAADAIAVGTITAVSEEADHWVVTLAARKAVGPAADQAAGDVTVHVMVLCDTPYGDTFDVGGEFVMLLSGPRDGAFFPVNTTQGLMPVVDGVAVPLDRSGLPPVTLSEATAAALGTPLGGPPGTPAPAGGLAPGDSQRGLPAALGPPGPGPAARAGVVWSAQAGVLYVVTWGSSSCPTLAAAATGDADGVTVTFVPLPADAACTADLGPTTSAVAVPEGADDGADLTVTLDSLGTVVVPPREAAGVTGPPSWLP
ncbi:hypothetical protein [Xylanimonas protaetiae]|uniref:Uncharacterized protein n=1 Tax=Xylanimonas protaetiae TaxID=2509457 RepID=A0A4P6FA14_9MICO|nr:hypothetical protein [Xylanimonas protaetiae]QAY70227.1 hypothetical protein ET471_09435 [Xylanimonas protaetiae]